MDQTAITYPQTTLNEMTGETIKTIMEDVCDNLFNADPYYQQGGDMVRVGGIEYTVNPTRPSATHHRHAHQGQAGGGHQDLQGCRLGAGGEGVTGEPIWDVVASYLRDKKVIKGVKLNEPKIVGIGKSNPGIADYKGGMS